MLEKPVRDKRSGFFQKIVNYGLKKFYNIGPWSSPGFEPLPANAMFKVWKTKMTFVKKSDDQCDQIGRDFAIWATLGCYLLNQFFT
jgi:hypothetical protein